jgi:mannose-1-phosphate guanylyltransferase
MLSPQVGELLLQVTQSQDLDEALQKVLRDYIELKVATLSAEIRHFEEKWGCAFVQFREQTQADYSYEVEKAFWEWEQLETLKSHFEALRMRWNSGLLLCDAGSSPV